MKIWKLAQACSDGGQAIEAVQKRIPKGKKVKGSHFQEAIEALSKQTKNAKRPREEDDNAAAKKLKKTEPDKNPHDIHEIG